MDVATVMSCLGQELKLASTLFSYKSPTFVHRHPTPNPLLCISMPQIFHQKIIQSIIATLNKHSDKIYVIILKPCFNLS